MLEQRLIAVAGMGGVGKTTVAATLAQRLGLVHVETDGWSRRLYGSVAAVNSAPDRSWRYSRVYGHAHVEAIHSLKLGRSIVIDGSYVTSRRRAHLLERCGALGVGAGIVLLDDEHGARARNRLREGDARLPDAELDATHVARVRAARDNIERERWTTWLVCEPLGAGWRVIGADEWGLAPLVAEALPSCSTRHEGEGIDHPCR